MHKSQITDADFQAEPQPGLLEVRVDRAKARIQYLTQRTMQAEFEDVHLLHESLRDVSTTLEELRCANEEIKLQNEALFRIRVALDDERRRYQDMFDCAPDAYLVTKPCGSILEANRMAGELFGVAPQRLVGKPVAVFLADTPGTPRLRPAFPADIHVASVHDGAGALVGYRWLVRDVTARKRADLQEVQAERLSAICQMVDGLAHESRNAMQRSQACLSMLMLELRENPEALDLLSRLKAAQRHLHGLYEGVRQYAAPVAMEPVPCDLLSLVWEVWTELSRTQGERQLDLTYRPIWNMNLTVEGDRDGLAQVFRNIIDNSLTSTPDPVHIEVRWCEVSLQRQGALQISFRDNGPGLNEESASRIFEPFFTTKLSGTGLGMSVAKRIVEAHNGAIQVGVPAGRGTEIVLTLPRSLS